MIRVAQLLVSALSLLILSGGPACAGQTPGDWSISATNLAWESEGRSVRVPAPRGGAELRIVDGALRVFRAGDEIHGQPIEVGVLAEVMWSPDGGSFALTESDGGAVGSWFVRVFSIDPEITGRNLTDRVAKSFAAVPQCETPEIPNVAALAWIDGSNLVVLGQVPPHSSCRNLGELRGYRVNVRANDAPVPLSPGELHNILRKFGGERVRPD